jgi:hypothetical protein
MRCVLRATRSGRRADGATSYLSGEIGSVDSGSAAELGIELDLGVFGAATLGGPHCHRHSVRSQKQLAVCWCGGSSGKYGTGCGVAVVDRGDMVAFLGVDHQGVDADEVSVGVGTSTACGCHRGTTAVPRSLCGHLPALMSRSAGPTTARGSGAVAGLPDSRRASTDCLRAPGPVPRSALGFVASPEPVPVASVAGKQRAVPDQVRGECRGVPRAAQRKAQLLRLPNGGEVQAEAPQEYVLINGNPGLDNLVDGHDHPHVAVRHHTVRARTRG